MTPADGSRATGAAGTRPLRSPLARAALLLLAALCVATGVIGIFVPGLPTTVFILIAGWAAARSSPRFSAWLWSHRLFGPMLKNWHETRSVSRRVKWTATLTMSLSAALLFAAPLRPLLAGGICGLMLAVLVWLWCLPEPARLAS